MKYLILSLLSIFLFYSCEQQSIETIETKTAVVEGFLHANHYIDSLEITQTFSYNQLEDVLISLDDLEVTLSDFSNEYSLTSIGNGFYQNTDVIIENDKSYRIAFVWEGEMVSAETYIPLKKEAQLSTETVDIEKIELATMGGGPPPQGGTETDPIEITWDNSEGDYYYIVIENLEEDPEYVNANLEASLANGDRPRFIFITEPQITDFYAIDARRELTQYGLHQIIVYRVNPEYAALYESSGNSTLSLEQPPTNVNNGLGIFTGVSSDTLYLEVNEI